MSVVLAVLMAAVGGMIGGLVGVGGGIIFVPALTIFLDQTQVQAESTSLLMIAIVASFGAARQYRYGNVNLRTGAFVALLSPIGVGAGVVVANAVSQRVLQLAFAGLALFIAARLVRRAFAAPAAAQQR